MHLHEDGGEKCGMYRTLQWGIGLVALAAWPGLASAQSVEEEDDRAADEEEEDDQIIVTATRRETPLSETPVAVTVVAPETLVERNVTNATNIEKLIPNLKVQDQRTLGMGAVQFTMRGVGNTDFTEIADPNVGFHVDEIYVPRPQGAISFLHDVERIEVLRGPQGTLFGRNSTVGTINVVTAKPDSTSLSGSVDGQYGLYNDRMLRGVLNVPIFNDHPVFNDMAVRLAAFGRMRDSYYTLRRDNILDPLLDSFAENGNGIPNNPWLSLGDPLDQSTGAGALNDRGLRVALRWKPIDRITLDGTYELFRSNSPPGPLTTRARPYTAFLDMPMTQNQTIQSVRASASYEQPNLFSGHYRFGFTDYEHISTVDLDAGVHRYRTDSYTAPGEAIFFYDNPFANLSTSHEVQLRTEWDLPVSALLGYFQFDEESRRDLWIDIPQAAGGVILFDQPSRLAASRAAFGDVTLDITKKFQLRGGLRYSLDRKTDVDGSRSDAFPGIGGLPFGCPLLAEEAGLTGPEARANNLCGMSTTQGQLREPYPTFDRIYNSEREFNSLDWAFAVSVNPDDDSVIYAKAASGYKSGGHLGTYYLPRTNEVINQLLDPEKLISYEAGAKGTLFNGALTIAADVFLMDYSNKQESVLVDFGDLFCPYTFGDFDRDGFVDEGIRDIAGTPGAFELLRFDPDTYELNATDEELAACNSPNFDAAEFPINFVELIPLNVSDALTAGAEIEWLWRPTPKDRVSGFATFNFVNRISNVDTSAFPFVLTDSLACLDREGGCADAANLDGNRLPYSPVVSAAINYAHDFNFGSGSRLTAAAAANVSSAYALSVWNVDCYTSVATGEEVCDNGDTQPAYATLDLNLRYTSPYSRWFLEAYGTNVTGTTYATFVRRQGADGVSGYAFNAPLQAGLRLGAGF